MWPWPLASWRSPTVPRTRVGPQERVEQHILVPPGVEEGAADGSLELEAALLGDTPRRRVLLDDDQVDAVELLVREDPVHDELDRFRHVAVPGGPVAVELVRQLQCVPVADRPEELDVADDLLARVEDDEDSLFLLPEAVLGEGALVRRLGEDAEREVRAAVPDVDVRGVQRLEIRLAHRTQMDALA